MHYKDVNVKIIFTVLIISLTLMFLSKYAYEQLKIQKPLEDYLTRHSQIKTYNIEEKEGYKVISVELKNVDNLMIFFEEFNNKIRSLLKRDNYKVDIVNKDEHMENVYYKMQFAVYEGIETGNYTKMIKELKEIAAVNELTDLKVFIDENFLYIQFSDKNSDFYKLIKK